MTTSPTMEPFRIEIANATLEDLGERLRRTRWPGEVARTGWERGANLDYLRRLVRRWAEE